MWVFKIKYFKHMHKQKNINDKLVSPLMSQTSKNKVPKEIKNKKSISPKRPVSPQNWAVRYRQISQQYHILFEQTKNRKHKYEMQQKQIQRLRQEKQRDQREIMMLRSMIGFFQKNDVGVQTDNQDEPNKIINQIQKKTNHSENKQELELPSFSSTYNSFKKSPSRKKSNSPKYQKLRYNLSPDRQKSFNRTAHQELTKNHQTEFKEFGNFYSNPRFRTQSLYNETDRYNYSHFNQKDKQKKVSFNSPTHQIDSNRQDALADQRQRHYGKLNSRLSNSPYSKLRFFKKKQ